MEEFKKNSHVSREFYQSKRLFSLAFVNVLKHMGSDYTMNILKETFAESTVVLFPMALNCYIFGEGYIRPFQFGAPIRLKLMRKNTL